jgi:predicted phage tail protein
MLNLTELWGTLEPFYDGRGEYFDYIFANKTTVLEAAKTVARAGRGVPMIVGTQLTIVRDGPASLPTALFGPHNIVKNTFEWEVSLYDDTEPDAIEIIYTDPETFQEESIVCGLDDDPVEPVRPKRVPLPGVTDRDIAYREGLYIRANQRHVREQVKFRTGLEGRIPRYGAFIGVAHDLPQWGQSGRLKSISGTTVTSLNKLEWAEGENHQIAFRDRYGNTVGPYSVTQGATSNVLILGAALPSNVLNSLIQDDNTGHPSLFLFGVTNDFYRQMKVTSIRNAGNDQVEVTAVNYSAIPHSFDGVSAPAKTSTSSVLSLPDVPTMSGITVEALPNTITDAIIKWEPVLGAKRYIIGQSFNEGVTWVQVGEVVTSFFYLPVTPGRLNVRVAATNQGTSLFKTWVGVVGLVRMIDDEENALTDDEGNVLYESES